MKLLTYLARFPTRAEVDNANNARMGMLSGKLEPFPAVDSGSINDVEKREKLLSNCMAPPIIHLKKGAQVMLIKNMEDNLVNGSLGKVVAFMDEATFDYYDKNEDSFAEAHEDTSDEERMGRAKEVSSQLIFGRDNLLSRNRS